VARGRSFRSAAQDLGYVQSAISQQIAFAERLLGLRLLERGKGQKGATLTDAGEVMVAHAEEILADMRAAQADLVAISEGRLSALRIGAFDHVTNRVAPVLVQRLMERFPAVDVQTTEARDDLDLLELIRTGDLDVAFADLPLPVGDFEWETLVSEPHVLVAPEGSALALEVEASGVDGFTELPLVRRRGCRHAARVEAQLRTRGLRANIVREADSSTMVMALVAAGAGVAIMPRMAASATRGTVVLGIGRLLSPRTLALVWHAGRGGGELQQDVLQLARAAAEVASAAIECDST
jgi:DNA-binding transcriptional LysR family regulator